MLFWIVFCLVVYTAGLFLPSLFLVGRMGVADYMGSRDDEPTRGDIHGRADRAHRNFCESLPVFLALAVLSMIVPDTDQGLALLGAQIFVIARIAYIPLYLMAVPVIRSGAWIAGFVGLIMMTVSLI